MSWTNSTIQKPSQSMARHLLELTQNGVELLKNPNLSTDVYENWIRYSEKVVEITTKEYDPNIYLGYLRILISTQQPHLAFSSFQRVKTCLDYLVYVLGEFAPNRMEV